MKSKYLALSLPTPLCAVAIFGALRGGSTSEPAPPAAVVVKSHATQDVLKPEVQARMSWKSTVTRLPDALQGLPFFRLPQSDGQLEFTVSKPGTVYLAPPVALFNRRLH